MVSTVPQALRSATSPSIHAETLAFLTAEPPLGSSQQSCFGGTSSAPFREVLDGASPPLDPFLEEYITEAAEGLETNVEYTQSDPVLGRPPSPNYAIMTTPTTQKGSLKSLSPRELSPLAPRTPLPELASPSAPQSTPATSNGSTNASSPLDIISPLPVIASPEAQQDKGKRKLIYSPPASPSTSPTAAPLPTEHKFADVDLLPLLRRSAALAAEVRMAAYGATSSKRQRDAEGDDAEDEELTPPPAKKQRAPQTKASPSKRRGGHADTAEGRASIPPRNKAGTLRHEAPSSGPQQDSEAEEAFTPPGSAITQRSSTTPKASSSKRPRGDDDDDDEYRASGSAKRPRTQPKPSSSKRRAAKSRKNPITDNDDESDAASRRSSGKRWPCTLPGCTKSCSREKDLERHVDSVHNKALGHKCPECGATYSRKDAMDRHVRKHHMGGGNRDDPPAAQPDTGSKN